MHHCCIKVLISFINLIDPRSVSIVIFWSGKSQNALQKLHSSKIMDDLREMLEKGAIYTI